MVAVVVVVVGVVVVVVVVSVVGGGRVAGLQVAQCAVSPPPSQQRDTPAAEAGVVGRGNGGWCKE